MTTPDPPATPDAILALRGQEGFGPGAARRALELALAPPRPAEWAAFLDRVLLVLGSALATAGVVFFFAYNWAELGRFARLGLLEAALAGAALGAWRVGLERPAGQVLLWVAAALVGPLLGVYGQAYQTGADSWEMFAAWSLLIVPWALAGRSLSLGLLLLILVNVTAVLAWEQELQSDSWWDASFHLAMAGLNGVVWAAWEWVRWRAPGRLEPSWASRVLAALVLGHLAVPCWMAVADDPDEGRWLALPLLGAALVGIFRLFRLRDRDLFVPALGLAAAISVVTVFLFARLEGAEEVGLLGLGLAVLGQVAAAAAWLRRMGAEP